MNAQTLTIREVLSRTTAHFNERGIDSARLDAEVLLSRALSCDRLALYLEHDKPLTESELSAYRELVRRRARREPVAYILGEKEFHGLSFAVGPGVLVPRPDTETLVDAVLADLAGVERPRILDLGTGSGAILLSVLHEVPEAAGVGVDVSAEALAFARTNGAALGLGDRVEWRQGSWYEALRPGERFDRILANPPYVASREWGTLAPDITGFEPRTALVAAEEGLADLRRIAAGASNHLAPGGEALVEIGHRQGAAVAAIFRDAGGFESVAVLPDAGRRDRVVRAVGAGRPVVGNHQG